MHGQISIPPAPGFREHILAVVTFMEGYLMTVKAEIFPSDSPMAAGVLSITNLEEVQALKARFREAPENERVPLNDREAVLLYACYVLMSRILLTEQGEEFHANMVKVAGGGDTEEDRELDDFSAFRQHFLMVNDHLIANSDQMIADAEGYAEMKEQLNALET